MSKLIKTSQGIWTTGYNSKLAEGYFKNELQQMIKDVEDGLKKDVELTHKYVAQAYNDDIKQRFREAKLGPTDYSLLHLAAKHNRQKFCIFLIEDIKIDKDIQCKSKSTPIHYLVKSNIITKKEMLLTGNINQQDSAKNKNLSKQILLKDTFEVFLKHNSDFNTQDENGYTALHHSVSKNNYAAVIYLLNVANIDLNLEDKKGLTPIQVACKLGNEDVAELLIDRMDTAKIINMCLGSEASSPLLMAAKNKNEKYTLINKILQKIVNSQHLEKILKKEDQNRQTILHLAVENNHLNIVELLFRDYNMQRDLRDGLNGNLPIHLAAKNGSCEMFCLLQKYDACSFKANNNLENALHIAAQHNRSKFIFEFLKYEKCLIDQSNGFNSANGTTGFMPCMCVCKLDEGMENGYVPCIRVKDNKQNTPLFTALATLNQKCVEELMNNEMVDLNDKGDNGNSIYHNCTDFDNIEALKYLLQKTNPQNDISVYAIKNSYEDTMLHSACRKGNLEMVKLIVNKLYDTNAPVEEIMFSKNKEGQTCFHIAAEKGYFNIIEYFLKEKKLISFMESVDNCSNTSLHLATLNGHSSIVSLLLEYGADANAKNEDNTTALDLSCRKGFFEISKNLITTSNLNEQETVIDDGEYPLHVACYEGAHEVVRLLLFKGAKINQLNREDQNCLDIAIMRGHREVIRVLLEDDNWYKLIRPSNSVKDLYYADDDDTNDQDDEESFKVITHITTNITKSVINTLTLDSQLPLATTNLNSVPQSKESKEALNVDQNITVSDSPKKQQQQPEKLIESPQLTALFESKMWDMLKIILDKCQTTEEEWNFTILDPYCKSLSNHPLMLIARSGQENLLKHDTTKLLLQLKWRFIPRFAFYFSLFVYLLYMIIFSVYTIELSRIGASAAAGGGESGGGDAFYSPNNFYYENLPSFSVFNSPSSSVSSLSTSQSLNQTDENNLTIISSSLDLKSPGGLDQQSYYYINKPDSSLFIFLVVLILVQLFKEICQMVFLDGFSYFLSLQNTLEILTYITSLISLASRNYYTQSSYGSIAVLFAFIVFPFFIQKLRMFGLYVVAFRRTLTNSAKFFPIFLIMFAGFILSYKIRSNFGVSYSNSTGYSIVRTFTMFVGELDTAKMGLYNTESSLPNYIIYLLFIGLMCTIVLNLFVGIAVGEIKTVLDEADIQQTSMRIMFVLKVQSAVQPLCENVRFLKNILKMNYRIYSYENENRLIKLTDTLYAKIISLVSSKEERINLSDPQKRLEDSFTETARVTSEQIKSIKFGFGTQISDVETKLFNSQRRLQDSLNEMASNTTQQINAFRDESQHLNEKIKQDLGRVQQLVEESISNSMNKTSQEFIYTNKYFNRQLADSEQRFLTHMTRIESVLIEMSRNALFQFESVKECCMSESKNLKSIIISSEKLIEDSLAQAGRRSTFTNNLNENISSSSSSTSDDQLKSLINNVLEKTIERSKSNEINFNIQKLQLESMSMSLKTLLTESLEDLKETNDMQFNSVKNRSQLLEDKLITVEDQLKQCKEMITRVAAVINNSINSILLNEQLQKQQQQKQQHSKHDQDE